MKPKKSIKNFIFLGLILLLAVFFRLYFNPVDIDDPIITYKYARNIASGNGFSYNPGERVLGTTTPLYAVILGFFNFLRIDIFLMSNLIGLISSLISIILIYLFFKENKMEQVGLFCAFILAILNDFVIYTMNGMETSFYIMLILLTFYLYSREKYYFASFFAGLCALTRPDGLLVGAVILSHFLISKRKLPIKIASVFVATLLPWIIFSLLRFGSPLPQSLISKRMQESVSSIPFFIRLFGFFFDRTYLILAIFFIIGLFVAYRLKKFQPYFAWFVLYLAAYLIIGVAAYAWYFIPLIPVFVIISALGIYEIKSGLEKNKSLVVKIISKAFPVFVCLIILPVSLLGIQHYKTKVDPNWTNYITVSKWIGENTKKNATIMHSAIGYIGYFSEKRMIDSAFIVTKIPKDIDQETLKQIYKRNYTYLYSYYKPDYLIYRSIEGVDEFIVPAALEKDYRQIKNFTFTRKYESEDLRFKISYPDYWAIYERKDLK
jgi:hypothetical protein